MPSRDAMPTPELPTEELAAFDPPLAEAVAAVLAESGVPTTLLDTPGGERSVMVPPARREEALSTLALRMDEVQALAGVEQHRDAERLPGGTTEDEWWSSTMTSEPHAQEVAHRPLVLERFRSFGWVAVALVPLLIIGLANVRLPTGVVVAIIVGSAVLLSAWRNGRFGGRD